MNEIALVAIVEDGWSRFKTKFISVRFIVDLDKYFSGYDGRWLEVWYIFEVSVFPVFH